MNFANSLYASETTTNLSGAETSEIPILRDSYFESFDEILEIFISSMNDDSMMLSPWVDPKPSSVPLDDLRRSSMSNLKA